ncbi:MAG TPA: FAD:protein FMN transferase [Phycisphaerae bacterium]|nr:FAD:protein FMN transferase [Phycisphaerae bacterium]HRY67213.1 FAD:protein FMN transferase [Phycisphaerae bacterium]HSA26417.1 FAD:protein FMN transferase [Phycisphaerae bacterium]
MGTAYTVKYAGRGRPVPGDLESLQEAVEGALRSVQQGMSVYLPDSELSRFNRHEDGSPFPMSAETFHVFRRAIQIGEESGGAFDITVGPIVNLYGFGPDPFRVNLPSEEELVALRPSIGYQKLELDSAAGTIRKRHSKVRCDLSAIAKGYGADRVAAVLDRRGMGDYMVEVGGEVRVRGCNLEGQPWRIAIERPVADDVEIHRVVPLIDQAIATTGDYRVFYIRDGKRISHTIDPRTGRPVGHSLASVTVIADDGESADAWATALMVLGAEEGGALAERRKMAALFLSRGEDGRILERATAAFPG